MYPILILRCEFVCLIMLLYLLISGHSLKIKRENLTFTRLSIYAVGHVVFDIITLLTVNNADNVSPLVNKGSHVLFYLFALLFSFELMFYTIQTCLPKKTCDRILIGGYAIAALYLASLPFLKIQYLAANGTNVSTGPATYIAFGIAVVYTLITILFICLNKKKIQTRVINTLLPLMILLLACVIAQVFVRELLFTGAAVTIVTVGFYYSLENPAEEYRRKLQYDTLTGVRSRHSYEEDIKAVEKNFAEDKSFLFSIIFCDLNNLKGVNDLYGHEEGDNYITGSASLMLKHMKKANSIYRMGGDEFMVLYTNVDEKTVKREIADFQTACAEKSAGNRYPFSVALGCASSGPQYNSVRDVLRVADYLMYKNKAEIKKEHAYLSTGANREKLNIAGLTDRMFEIFTRTSKRNYFFICNMETNVSRISPDMVEYFGLEDEFIYDFGNTWINYIHPEDQDIFREDDIKLHTGKKASHTTEYRARSKEGLYVVCTCRGFIIKGTRGEPDMYAGTIENHGIADDFDPVTGLRNDDMFIRHLSDYIDARASVALLRLSIMDFGRINMLYGFSGGNELLRQFTVTVKRMVPANASLFRLNGTNFVVCLPDATRKNVQEIYEGIRAKSTEGIPIQETSVPICIAGGAFMLSRMFDGSASSIYSSLIYAHDRSEHNEHGRLVYYNDPVEGGLSRNYKLLSRVHEDALDNHKGFFLRYQPILRTDSGKIHGVEALVRWNDEVFGEVLPDSFIPWLQNDPCFFELGNWILRQAMVDGKQFLKKMPDLRIDVNMTSLQLMHTDFTTSITNLLKETGFPASNLCFELNDRCYEMELSKLRETVDFFHSIGAKVALDNINVLNPSLGMILQLPIDEIKLDRQFVRDVPVSKPNLVLLNMLLEASKSLHFSLCFEGIEDCDAYCYFRQFVGMNYQGFYQALPMIKEEFEKFIDER